MALLALTSAACGYGHQAPGTIGPSPASAPSSSHAVEPAGPASSDVAAPNVADVFAMLEAAPGEGSHHPYYRVAIHRDGAVDYLGIGNVKTAGIRRSSISADAVVALAKLLEDLDPLWLGNSWWNVDADRTSVVLVRDGGAKVVSPAPAILEKKFDELAGVTAFIGAVDEQRQRDLYYRSKAIDPIVSARIMPGARSCHRAGLVAEPTQGGRLVLEADIAVTGEVLSVSVGANTGFLPDVIACIASVARGVRFDTIAAYGETIRLEVVLEPEQASAAPSIACPDGMAFVSGGLFIKDWIKDAVKLAPYCLDRTEVTVAAYADCVETHACAEPARWAPDAAHAACNWKRPGFLSHPANCIDGSMASTYCRSVGKRLPTDLEWKWAEQNGWEGQGHPWGSELYGADLLNACGAECATWLSRHAPPLPRGTPRYPPGTTYDADDGWPTTAPVGRFPAGANRWGVLDLEGNVSEWTTTVDSPGEFVARGISWRGDNDSTIQNDHSYAGVRCVR